jgi:hypothetical protein
MQKKVLLVASITVVIVLVKLLSTYLFNDNAIFELSKIKKITRLNEATKVTHFDNEKGQMIEIISSIYPDSIYYKQESIIGIKCQIESNLFGIAKFNYDKNELKSIVFYNMLKGKDKDEPFSYEIRLFKDKSSGEKFIHDGYYQKLYILSNDKVKKILE